MTIERAKFSLPTVMKLEDCNVLHAFLAGNQGNAVDLDCTEVTRMTGLAAQLIHCASGEWAADGIDFMLSNPSTGCTESLKTLGLSALLDGEGASA